MRGLLFQGRVILASCSTEQASKKTEQLDILMDGPYLKSQAIHAPDSPVSSRNQQVHSFHPDCHNRISWASDRMEVRILKDGARIVTGFRGSL